ncbi:MAG: hypothetical protein OXH92_15020 [Bryobacterales bacterium]|nr:hypothetical protein [Bryobacterales bacterium]MDE0292715.1 hypothetical protein [Bryobacterales bacterium]MDE0435314.1 hypothetical protein [Bryobacterales bacterium]
MSRNPRAEGGDTAATPACVKRLAPRPDGPLTHFALPRGEKAGSSTASVNATLIFNVESMDGVGRQAL